MKKFDLGLVSVSFRENSPREILEAMKKANLTVIEWGSDIHAPCNDSERLKEIADLQREYGISCSSYGTYFRLGVTPLDELADYIAAAKVLDTNILRVWCGNLGSKEYNETPELKEKLFEDCKKAVQIASQARVTLCLECHNNTYTDTKESALEIICEVDSENFKMYWQPNQFYPIDENIRASEMLAPYTKHVHVFNWEDKNKFPLCGAVKVWKKYLKHFEREHALLLEFMPDGKIESLCEEAQALFEIVEGF